jgi:crotonobetainyl-CoA:carnitine CoA-transferase CaiB-like acyl-CoA transferase
LPFVDSPIVLGYIAFGLSRARPEKHSNTKTRREEELAQALEGIKVVDLSQVAAVPMAARHLADFGADVVHVEHPVRGDTWRIVGGGISAAVGAGIASDVKYIWETYNRNKRGITLDLSQEEGRRIMYKLLEDADVFLTNMRLFELEKFEIEYKDVVKINPRIIYGSLTSFGKKGPERNLPGYETNGYFARSGVHHMLQEVGRPPVHVPLGSGDNVAAMAMAYGVMLALYVREKTGEGQELDISLFQSGVYQICIDVAGSLVTGADRQMLPRDQAKMAPANYYLTKDERWLRTVVNEQHWARYCRALGRPELPEDPRFKVFKDRQENHADLFEILDAVFKTKTLPEWKKLLDEHDIPWAPVQTLPEVCNDVQARENNFFVPIDHPEYGRIEVIDSPVKLSKTPSTIRTPAPEFSQHTEEVLLENGFSWEEIALFKEKRVVA